MSWYSNIKSPARRPIPYFFILFLSFFPASFLTMIFSPPARRTALLSLFFALVEANGRDQQPTMPGDNKFAEDIVNFSNNRYTTALKMGDKSINVLLDTGSTDLWMNPRGGVGPFEDTGVVKTLRYGEGATFINGTIGLGEMTIARHKIPKQGVMSVWMNAGGGICGLVGLGFDSPNAGIVKSLSDAGLDGAKLGQSVLSNIFDMNPSKGRFFAISLSRLGDAKDTAAASLSIQEYDERYANVQWMAKRHIFPPNGKSWHVLFDGVTVNGVKIPWTKNDEATPANQLVVGLDTGTTNFLVPPAIRAKIYSEIPGAVLAKNSSLHNSHWSADRDVWVVPCNTPISMSAYFNGQPYPVHPLDMTAVRTQKGPDGTTYTYCVGSVTNGGTIVAKKDALFGDSFLRNVYTVFNFGDNQTSPFIQFLAQTNEWESTQDFAHVRKNQLGSNPHEVDPAELVKIFDGVTVTPPASVKAAANTANCAAAGNNKVQAVAGNLASSDSDSGSSYARYLPAILGLLVANLVAVLGLGFIAVWTWVRKGGKPRGHSYMPTKTKDDSSSTTLFRTSFSQDKPYSDR
ncbi:Six-hairpin glycosidase [Favolaschia claudopus]|uniref:Six-hairpin glycosidase n=1 Tax=Favolaschia claudopus TaxID=2862362 RepID=A0AAW0BF19_9AGAR